MKRFTLTLFILTLAALACNLPFTTAPAPTAARLELSPTPSPRPSETPDTATAAPQLAGTPVTFERLSLVIPAGVASGGTGELFARADGDAIAPWEVTPGHLELTLNGYALQNTFHTPRLFVYPAPEYAALQNGAASSVQRLQAILASPQAPITADNLPFVPFFNAGAQVVAKTQRLAFQNGAGVRFITQYGQDVGPITNLGLFYHFQGLTSDGKYYLIAILPVNLPTLQADYEAPLPPGGLPFPDYSDPNADFAGYYTQMADLLESTLPGALTPHLENLDLLVQSIQITP